MTAISLLELTWPAAAALPNDTLGLIPLGAIEQHGPHLPLGTDLLIAQALARQIAELLSSPVLISPCPTAGLSTHHLAFPGTISLQPAAFAAILDDIVDGYHRMGVTQIAIFSAHGGNFAFLAEYEHDRDVAAFSDRGQYFSTMTDAARTAGLDIPSTDEHAGALETSQALAFFPELVGDHASVRGFVDAFDGWEEELFEHGIQVLSDQGVLGDPRAATATAGHAINTALSQMLADWVREELK